MVAVPESLLAERRRIGADRRDEMWDGLLHMVQPGIGPATVAQRGPQRGLRTARPAQGSRAPRGAGVFRAPDDYRGRVRISG